ncbi:ATP-binding protein [Bradyrhizobium barranii subsp. apii]|uniref:ATP-binding protein n=1 Tax=Bradyrhizobium barranii subsp. apii TaxID=2819348 RepID=A0A8T5V8B8_9BRAD|nr:ATP-binding protein [Bradyrhizobium barranii]UPT91410.1 ATP-binding protein [Bradyrhizobium barranii subsp. apii]
MKPWRELAVPHQDVLEGTFQQSEFAADITAVNTGKASSEYQDAVAFFDRTFITEGMALLLTQVAQRLAGKGGEPVVQLQTAFGGGKTHTMLAVYHLATRKCTLSELAGVSALVDKAGLMAVPQARVAVLDGTAHAPGQSWKRGGQTIKTIWGELAWQLGGTEAFTLVAEADATGTSPGKDVLRALLEKYAPCVVLIDELVAYVRQFPESQAISGGSYDSNLSFVQALTEAVKLVPRAIVLASLPESDLEAGSQRGVATLRALEKTFGRVQALWKPVATEEAFEIVRRRLFEPVRDERTRENVCRAFANIYLVEGVKLPAETQERRYYDRLLQAYPIHPEVFDRLYEDWTTIDGFQRTRGVLKLMAKVIYRLWKDDNKDLLIMPGSLPLHDGSSRNELTYYLPAGWDAVIERDIDGERAETTALESREPRFGQVGAARRISRTIFLGSAPSSVVSKAAVRGLDRAHIILGCLQPGQTSSIYTDALSRLADRLHYLNASGDKSQDATRFWFDTRANLRREMEDRKRRFDDKTEVRGRIADAVKKVLGGASFFEGMHIFTPHADVPDDSALRLVVLPPEAWYTKDETRPAFDAVLDTIAKNGTKPRYRSNRLIFLAADHSALSRLADVARIVLAWASIVDDVKEGRLNIDLLQKNQAEKELKSAEEVLPRAVRECYKWLLCPMQDAPTDPKLGVEAFALNVAGSAVGAEIERVCTYNELVIVTWSPIHLRAKLREFYWKGGLSVANAAAFFEDTLRYLYMPRLKSREVLAQAIHTGATSKDFFGTAYGQTDDKFEGFALGSGSVVFDDTLLLIEPEAAGAYQKANHPRSGEAGADQRATTRPGERSDYPIPGNTPVGGASEPIGKLVTAAPAKAKSFFGAADIPTATAKMRLVQLADEIVSVLASDPNANIRLTVEISADFPDGVSDGVKRAVSENARSLGLKTADWE